MKTVTLTRCILLGLTFCVFGLNGVWQTKAQRRQAMSYSIPTLLTRNLHDVFGENDPVRRRAAIDEIFTEDCVFYEPNGGVYRGRDEIDRVAGSIRATHADSRYQPIAEPEELGNAGRVKWVEGRIGEEPRSPALISSSPGMDGLPPFISFSTSCRELDSDSSPGTDSIFELGSGEFSQTAQHH